MAKQRRRLTDLYVVGKAVNFDDGTGEPVAVWLQKLNPVENETAMRKANAVRSRIVAARRKRDGEEYEEVLSEVNEMSRMQLLDSLASEAAGKAAAAVEDEIAAQEEWSKDGYLDGLKDSWEETLAVRYADNNEDEEAKQVYDELSRFAQQVEAVLKQKELEEKVALEPKTDEELVDMLVKQRLEFEADFAWLREYRKCEIWLSIREPDNHNAYYFQNREEVDSLAQELYLRLLDEYRAISVEAVEGKDSPPAQPSSQQSPPPAAPVPAKSSGRKAQTG